MIANRKSLLCVYAMMIHSCDNQMTVNEFYCVDIKTLEYLCDELKIECTPTMQRNFRFHFIYFMNHESRDRRLLYAIVSAHVTAIAILWWNGFSI